MAKAKNLVIEGTYKGNRVSYDKYMNSHPVVGNLRTKDGKPVKISPFQVESYELITAETVKNGTSAILRGAAGAALFGTVGLLAGLTAKSNKIFNVLIKWKDGQISIIEVDEKIYNKILTTKF